MTTLRQQVATYMRLPIKPDCQTRICNPVTFTILLEDLSKWATGCPIYYLATKALASRTCMNFVKKTQTHSVQQFRVFDLLYEHVQQEVPKTFPSAGNLFT